MCIVFLHRPRSDLSPFNFRMQRVVQDLWYSVAHIVQRAPLAPCQWEPIKVPIELGRPSQFGSSRLTDSRYRWQVKCGNFQRWFPRLFCRLPYPVCAHVLHHYFVMRLRDAQLKEMELIYTSLTVHLRDALGYQPHRRQVSPHPI